jgi:uncharacterized cupredoxin-like copper-binding protein
MRGRRRQSREGQDAALPKKLLAPGAALVLAVAAAGSSQAAGSVVNVALWDKGADVPMPTNLGLGMGGDMSKATMGISTTPDSVRPGIVTFEVLNGSKDTIHEMIVAKLADAKQPLPYICNENRVDEDKEGDLGEVSELDAGKSGALRIEMAPGKYILYCNVPGHYTAGMWTTFTVK